jgi:hypothetical protein
MSPTRFLSSALLGAALSSLCASASDAERVDFNYHIRPIISSKCYSCHGQDEASRKAKLRLDIREEALKERDGIRAIVPGNLEESELVLRILSHDRDEVMPPPKEGEPLTKEEIELVKRWVAQGAEYKEHWAWSKPERPPVPATPAVPEGIDSPESTEPNRASTSRAINPVLRAWARTPIDSFILERQLRAGLKPSSPADPAVLARRLHLDLIGLPPQPDELQTFLDDAAKDREGAVNALVDRLLASPHFGEKWARVWLDLARYADSTGYGSDKFRLNIWPYRDWVINAFNRNLPYDQFTIEQLAGDLLPNATPEQIAATAFHRNTMTNVEGGTIDEEYRVAAVKDRVATTGQTWMGLTFGCAQCHTHKFDPISHHEYYKFFAILNQTEDSDREDEEPKMPMPTPAQKAEMERLKSEIEVLDTQLKATSPELEAELHAWEADVHAPVAWTPLEPTTAGAEGGTILTVEEDKSIMASGAQPKTDHYTVSIPGPLDRLTGLRLEALADDTLPERGPGRQGLGNFVITDLRAVVTPAGEAGVRARYVRVEHAGRFLHLAEVQAFSAGENVAQKGSATQSSTGFGASADRAIDGKTDGRFTRNSVQHTADGDKDPWWEVDLGSEQPLERVVLWNRADGLDNRIKGAKLVVLDEKRQPVFEQKLEVFEKDLTANLMKEREVKFRHASAGYHQKDFHPATAIDGSRETGWAVAGATGRDNTLAVQFREPLAIAADETLTIRIAQRYADHTLGRFRLSATTRSGEIFELPAAIRDALALEPTERSDAQREAVQEYFRPYSKHLAELGKRRDAAAKALAAIKPTALPILRELAADKRRKTHLLDKGNYLAPRDEVSPGLPAAFAGFFPKADNADRRAMAEWLVHPDNPLTSRVAVNRFWAQLFGTGLVATEEDFGTQGALPSHPELLDWLAVTFHSPRSEDSAKPGLGWDIKALLKLIVSSATYQQSSRVTPDLLERDPRNRLLSAYPRRRLEAESVRDQALALSGLLSPKIGGPSVYPPQPDGMWKVAFNGGQNAYPTSTGEDRYRRGLYTFWRRTMPYPSMNTFDAPSRESCTLRRSPTNTPLQAFVTLNDPAFVECAQALARRILKEGGDDDRQRIRWALTLALARTPSGSQIEPLVELLAAERLQFAANADAAKKLAGSDTQPLPPEADPVELAAWTVLANVLLNLDGVLMKS